MQESDGGMAGGCDENDLRVLYGEKQIFSAFHQPVRCRTVSGFLLAPDSRLLNSDSLS